MQRIQTHTITAAADCCDGCHRVETFPHHTVNLQPMVFQLPIPTEFSGRQSSLLRKILICQECLKLLEPLLNGNLYETIKDIRSNLADPTMEKHRLPWDKLLRESPLKNFKPMPEEEDPRNALPSHEDPLPPSNQEYKSTIPKP